MSHVNNHSLIDIKSIVLLSKRKRIVFGGVATADVMNVVVVAVIRDLFPFLLVVSLASDLLWLMFLFLSAWLLDMAAAASYDLLVILAIAIFVGFVRIGSLYRSKFQAIFNFFFAAMFPTQQKRSNRHRDCQYKH